MQDCFLIFLALCVRLSWLIVIFFSAHYNNIYPGFGVVNVGECCQQFIYEFSDPRRLEYILQYFFSKVFLAVVLMFASWRNLGLVLWVDFSALTVTVGWMTERTPGLYTTNSSVLKGSVPEQMKKESQVDNQLTKIWWWWWSWIIDYELLDLYRSQVIDLLLKALSFNHQLRVKALRGTPVIVRSLLPMAAGYFRYL